MTEIDVEPEDTPFVPRLRELGATEWIEAVGRKSPAFVTSPEEEYSAVREACGAMDLSFIHKTDVRGPNALDIANAVVARDLKRLPEGRIAYTVVVDERGMMIDDVTVYVFSPDYVRICGGTTTVPELLEQRATGTETEVVLGLRDTIAHLCVQGPRSRELLEPLTPADVSNEAFPYYTFRPQLEVAGIPTHVNRMGYTAELGYELWVPAERALELWDAIFETGGPLGIKAVGSTAIMMIRIEAGLMIGDGIDYDDTVSPWECCLGWSVDLDKEDDFIGRDALGPLRDSAPQRTVTVRLDDGGPEAFFAPLERNGSSIGRVNMSMPSPLLGSTLGLARVRREEAVVGNQVTAKLDDGRVVAGEILDTPVYDPERTRVRS